jgi:hypothetical protein
LRAPVFHRGDVGVGVGRIEPNGVFRMAMLRVIRY